MVEEVVGKWGLVWVLMYFQGPANNAMENWAWVWQKRSQG